MNAVRLHGSEDLRLEDVAEPRPEAHEVVIEVAFCGICGSDMHLYQEGPVAFSDDARNQGPATLGHEFAGRLVEVGKEVRGLAVDDRVTVNPNLSCGRCWFCLRNQSIHCESLQTIGIHRDGGMAPYVRVPVAATHKLADSIDDDVAALTEPLTVAMRAVRRSGQKAGDSVAIIGAGPIGLMTLAMAGFAGASAVHVVEPSAVRRQAALELGAAGSIGPDTCSPPELREMSPGRRGFDVAFECAGAPSALDTAVNATRPGGTTVVLGLSSGRSAFGINDVLQAERRVVGSYGSGSQYFEPMIQLLSSARLDPRPLITGKLDLTDAIGAGFRTLAADRDSHIKVLIDPRPMSSSERQARAEKKL